MFEITEPYGLTGDPDEVKEVGCLCCVLDLAANIAAQQADTLHELAEMIRTDMRRVWEWRHQAITNRKETAMNSDPDDFDIVHILVKNIQEMRADPELSIEDRLMLEIAARFPHPPASQNARSIASITTLSSGTAPRRLPSKPLSMVQSKNIWLGNTLLLDATTLLDVIAHAEGAFKDWLLDRRNRRSIPHRFEKCGYVPVRSESKDGFWVIDGKRQVVYARQELSLRDQIIEARKLAKDYAGMKIK